MSHVDLEEVVTFTFFNLVNYFLRHFVFLVLVVSFPRIQKWTCGCGKYSAWNCESAACSKPVCGSPECCTIFRMSKGEEKRKLRFCQDCAYLLRSRKDEMRRYGADEGLIVKSIFSSKRIVDLKWLLDDVMFEARFRSLFVSSFHARRKTGQARSMLKLFEKLQ
jgi:hypothetical protein